MKTIILCGGKGTRLNEETEFRPKPLVQIGGIPILMHIMQIYAHYGHKDFILALGHKGHMIKDYFLTLSRYEDDFQFDTKTGQVTHFEKRMKLDYKVTFAETGEETQTAERVLRVAKYIPKEDKYFMVTFGDGVSTIDVSRVLQFHKEQEKKHGVLGTISAVHPPSTYGRVRYNNNELVATFEEKKPILDDYIDGGFQVYSYDSLKYFKENEMLFDTLIRLTKENKLASYRHAGFWKCMDTMQDYKVLNSLWEKERPWAVWEK